MLATSTGQMFFEPSFGSQQRLLQAACKKIIVLWSNQALKSAICRVFGTCSAPWQHSASLAGRDFVERRPQHPALSGRGLFTRYTMAMNSAVQSEGFAGMADAC